MPNPRNLLIGAVLAMTIALYSKEAVAQDCVSCDTEQNCVPDPQGRGLGCVITYIGGHRFCRTTGICGGSPPTRSSPAPGESIREFPPVSKIAVEKLYSKDEFLVLVLGGSLKSDATGGEVRASVTSRQWTVEDMVRLLAENPAH